MRKRLNLKIFLNKFINRIKNQKISIRFLLLDTSLILIIITISFNIFIAYREGVENLGKLKIEEEKLVKLQQENARLSEEENYYRSIEFRKAYARDSLNLTKNGETLYYVVREQNQENVPEAQKLFSTESLNDIDMWKLLIFGT